jgi:hypothetical protein
MTKKAKTKKGLKVSMVIKNDNENEYLYKLKNGSWLSFRTKNFPLSCQSSSSQLSLF